MQLQLSFAGRITGTHNLDGGLKILFHLKDEQQIARLKYIFIELITNSFIPYFVKKVNYIGEGFFLFYLEDVIDLESAKELIAKRIYIDGDQIKLFYQEDTYRSLEGFELIDKKLGKIGRIEQLIESPGQVLAEVAYRQKYILIPLVESTIKKIDVSNAQVLMQLPDGLIEAQI